MVCPITHACFRELNRTYFVNERYLYEDLADAWMELGEAIQRDEPSDQSLRLRGCYLVEVLYTFAVDRLQVSHCFTPKCCGQPAKDKVPGPIFREYPRSYEGLTALIQVCERELVALTADQGEMLLIGEESDTSSWKMLADQLDIPKFMLTVCGNAAMHLRGGLGADVSSLPAIGRLFAMALIRGSIGPSSATTYLRASLRTNIHNPTSPFNRVDF